MPYPYNNPYPQNIQQGYPQFPQTYPAYQGTQPVPVQSSGQGQQPTMQPIQNSGLMPVKSFAEVNAWQIAPGNSMTFYLEGNGADPPVICVKKKGFSQFDPTTLEIFDLVKREDSPQTAQNNDISAAPRPTVDLSGYVKIADFEAFAAKYGDIPATVNKLTETVSKLQFDVDAMTDKKSTKKMVQNARKDAEEE